MTAVLVVPLAAAAVAASLISTPATAAPVLKIPLAKPGNVTIARVTLTPAGSAAAPRLNVTNGRALGRDVAVLVATEPQRRTKGAVGRYAVKPRKRKLNIVIIHRHRGRVRALAGFDLAGPAPAAARFAIVRVPAGFSATKPLLAQNVVQENPPPPFECTPGAPVKTLYVGGGLRGASPRALGSSACLLALDRPAPVGIVSQIGGDYCALASATAGGAGLELSFAVTCSFAGLNFLELDFGHGLTVLGELAFPGAQCRARASVQDCAFPAGVKAATTFRERILFDRKPPAGGELLLRGSADGGKTFPFRFSGRFPSRAAPGG